MAESLASTEKRYKRLDLEPLEFVPGTAKLV